MKLERLATMTGYMRHGMTLRDFFQEAVRCYVPGLPYVDVRNQIVGRISIRDVYKRIAVPDSFLRLADAMGDQTDKLDIPEIKVMEISPRSSTVKALSLMELHNSSYIFLIENGQYEGVVTRMEVAKRMLECIKDMEQSKSIAQQEK
jgi:CBS domain-containing protein